jgi:hypothetical protein
VDPLYRFDDRAAGGLRRNRRVAVGFSGQLNASDTWSEYQASREKSHLYAIQAYSLIDTGVAVPPGKQEAPAFAWKPLPPQERLRQYIAQVNKEMLKQKSLTKQAQKDESESARDMREHHRFGDSVALIQVAIALSAIAMLSKSKPMWTLSLVSGAAGIIYFFSGFLLR